MTDWLKDVGKRVRERQAAGERLDALGRAALSGERTAELERQLGVDAEAARIAYEPLSTAFKTKLQAEVARSLAQAEKPGPLAEELEPDASLSAAPSVPEAPPHAQVRPLTPRRWALWVVLPAAAAFLFWLSSERAEQPALLARYELEVEHAIARERAEPAGDATEPLLLAAGSSIGLSLQPERPVQGVFARVFLLTEGARPQQLPATFERSDVGALRARVQLPEQLPERGTLVVVVADAQVQAQAYRLATESSSSGLGWQRLERPFARMK